MFHFISPFRWSYGASLFVVLYGLGFSLIPAPQVEWLTEGAWQLQRVQPARSMHAATVPLDFGHPGSTWHFPKAQQTYQLEADASSERTAWALQGRVLQILNKGHWQEAWVSQLSPNRLVLRKPTPQGCTRFVFARIP